MAETASRTISFSLEIAYSRWLSIGEPIEPRRTFSDGSFHGKIMSFAYTKDRHNKLVRLLFGPLKFQATVTVRQVVLDSDFNWLVLLRVWISSKLRLKAFSVLISARLLPFCGAWELVPCCGACHLWRRSQGIQNGLL